VHRKLAGRLLALVAIFAVAVLFLTYRLTMIQIVDGASYAAAVAGETYRTVPVTPTRGEILDTRGRVLAIERQTTLVYVIPNEVTDAAAEAQAMAPVLGEKASAIEPILSRRGGYRVVASHIGPLAADRLEAMGLAGIGFTPKTVRSYPDGAEPVVGFVNGEQVGVAGVEETYNRQLAGTAGLEKVMVDAVGRPLPSYGTTILKPAKAGDSLELTIDATLQAYAQSALAAAVKQHGATSGRAIIMNPQTGAILAMAQVPTYSPSTISATTPTDALVNQMVQYAFYPASVFKTVTGSLALLDGVANIHQTWDDPGYKIVQGVKIYTWNRKGFGILGWDGIFADSSDVAFMDLGLAVGVQNFFKGLNLFHLDRPTGIDLPGEATGITPPPQRTTQLDLAEMAFGQTLTVTPVQMAAAVAAIADGGVWHTPHVGKALITPTGTKMLAFPSQRILPTTIADDVIQGMKAVVEGGTGKVAQIPGYVLAGKTGTSSLVGLPTKQYIGSFICYGPVPDPRVLVYVQISDPRGAYYGDQTAAPVVKQLLKETFTYLRIPPNAPLPATTPITTVPDVIGMSPDQAIASLDLAGLIARVSGSGAAITSIQPRAGTQMKVGGVVFLAAGGASGAAGTVPSVIGLTTGAAASALFADGYQMAPSGSGYATAQNPAAGTKASQGTVVRVTFSPQGGP